MQALAAILGATILIAVAIFVGCLAGAAVGALAGWIVGLVFDESMIHFAKMLGTTAEPYQIGAILGFIGGFFRPAVSK